LKANALNRRPHTTKKYIKENNITIKLACKAFSISQTYSYIIRGMNTELRTGKRRRRKGTPEFLEYTMKLISELEIEEPLLFRFDGGNDSGDIPEPLEESGHFYIVKRNFILLKTPLFLLSLYNLKRMSSAQSHCWFSLNL
jgi:hypothetical protein